MEAISNAPRREKGKIGRVQEQIESVKEDVQETISLALDREEMVNLLDDKADKLHDSSLQFRKQSTKVRKRMFYNLWMNRAKIAALVVIPLLVFTFWKCGLKFDQCYNK